MIETLREWGAWLGGRLGSLLLSLLLVSIATFAIIHFVGNPVYLLLGPRYTQDMLEALTKSLGLDQPLWRQYLTYIGGLLRGDLGLSHYTGNTVAADLAARFPATLELSTYSLLVAMLWAIPAGIRAGMRPRGVFATFTDLISRAGVSMPSFWLGLLLIYVFYAKLSWLPPPLGRIDDQFAGLPVVTGWETIDTLLAGNLAAFGSAVAHLTMPVLALAVTTSPSVMQITRARTDEIMRSDFIRSARAFGLSRGTVYFYMLRNILGPVLTMATMTYGFLISGTVLVEVVFSWPGMGLYAVAAMNNSDYEPVMGVVLVSAAFYLVIYAAADIINALVDPRIRLNQ